MQDDARHRGLRSGCLGVRESNPSMKSFPPNDLPTSAIRPAVPDRHINWQQGDALDTDISVQPSIPLGDTSGDAMNTT